MKNIFIAFHNDEHQYIPRTKNQTISFTTLLKSGSFYTVQNELKRTSTVRTDHRTNGKRMANGHNSFCTIGIRWPSEEGLEEMH